LAGGTQEINKNFQDSKPQGWDFMSMKQDWQYCSAILFSIIHWSNSMKQLNLPMLEHVQQHPSSFADVRS
jgi:hypothetical protein